MLFDLMIMSNTKDVTSARAWREFLNQRSVNAIITFQAIIKPLLEISLV